MYTMASNIAVTNAGTNGHASTLVASSNGTTTLNSQTLNGNSNLVFNHFRKAFSARLILVFTIKSHVFMIEYANKNVNESTSLTTS